MRTNFERANSVHDALDAFIKDQGLEYDEIEAQVGDMICNLLHYANVHLKNPQDAMQAARLGVQHFIAEVEAEKVPDGDELGPEVLVSINAEVQGTDRDYYVP